ncbi:thioredoxin domain-containing protein [Kaarinaea lacus]
MMKNRLAMETSPYLLQHADNPVQWYPWNEEALNLARQMDKPILLSIGYSACHWCHVMAHESFEDESTAQVMNDLFVNIKVDREERPDLDKIYQFAHQVLTQRGGGWPLTMILTPDDNTPFFAGTYFPREPRYGMPSFIDIIKRVESFYRQNREDIDKQNDALKDVLRQVEASYKPTDASLSPMPLDEARRQLEKSYDGLYGGFGEAPKFPHPSNLSRLFRHWYATNSEGNPDKAALDMALTTLKTMGMGGINDQLGGGFCRYSVDQEWMIPHFEKMLYDNGPLLHLYSEAWTITGDAFYQRIASETAEWVMREMQADEGGYYSSLDADSEGEEGRFYVWTPEDVKPLLSNAEYDVFSHHYGLDKQANFEGKWHLHVYETLEDTARKFGISLDEVNELLASARQTLFRMREERVKPGRDEKVLTAWNGLMIKGMAAAGRRLQRPDFIRSAESALAFIKKRLWVSGRLLAAYKDGKAHLNAYLDDYVFLVDAILELLQARWNAADLKFAVELIEVVLDVFEDEKQGGFYFTSSDHEVLIQRPKVLMDESLPAGNGVAAYVLQRMGHLLGESRYLDAAEKTLRAAWDNIQRTPYAHNTLLDALEEYLYPPQAIIVRSNAEDAGYWSDYSAANHAPRRFLVAIPDTEQELPGLLEQRSVQGDFVAYVCDGHQCRPPITEPEDFKVFLNSDGLAQSS